MQKQLYFNTAANGLLDPRAKEKLDYFYAQQYSDPASYFMDWMGKNKEVLRMKYADLIGCEATELAFVPNTSYAMASFCSSLPKKSKVLMYDQDYPSVYEPFRLQGFDMNLFSAQEDGSWDMEQVKRRLIDDDIDVFAISHCQYLSGYKADIKAFGEFCRDYEILFLVDATQTVGAEPIDVSESHIDVLVASNYKWMNAGLGSAILYVKKEWIERYPPTIGGYGSYVVSDKGFVYQSSMLSYEPGHQAVASLLCLEAVLETRNKFEVERIAQHNAQLAQQFRTSLRNANWLQVGADWDVQHQSAVVVADGDEALLDKLKKLNIKCSFRGGKLRFGFHHYNNEAEIIEMFERLGSMD